MIDMQTSTQNLLLQQLHRNLIAGLHILHYNNVLDAFGHLSVRHPLRPEIFVMSRNAAPGTITSPTDLVEYFVEDARPVDPNAPGGFLERCIHSECYKRYPAIQSVIHSHSEAVVPYTISGVPLRASYHMAGFLGSRVPVWDISDAIQSGDIQDMLVRNINLGSSLAASFGTSSDNDNLPLHAVSLMRGHGFTVLAENIPDCVLRAVYTQKNAAIQTTALTTRLADPSVQNDVKYLTDKEASAADQMARASAHRPWDLWLREVEFCGLYRNSA